jgi:endonuclease/exonuclease/phosphatase (EEP) superfamily protein YafD
MGGRCAAAHEIVKTRRVKRAAMRAILRVLRLLVRVAAFLLAAGCLLAILAGQGGRFSDQLDVANHFLPGFVLGALVAAGVGWRDRATVLVAALALAIVAWQVAPELLFRGERAAPTPGAEQVKLIQFNVYFRNRDPEATARWILAQNADFVVMEEAYVQAEPVVEALRARYPYRVDCSTPEQACDTDILSLRPPIASGSFRPLTGAAVAWATYDGKGGPFTVIGVHHTWPIPAGPQRAQVERLAAALGRFDRNRLIISGDFNSTPWSFALRRQDRWFGLERRTHAMPSWPAGTISRFRIPIPAPLLPIDHVYAGKAWRTLDVHRGPRLGSDHYPVVATLQAGP